MRATFIGMILFLSLIGNNTYGQSLADSVNFLYAHYFDLTKTKGDVDSINTTIKTINVKFADFNTILQSNNTEIKKLTKNHLFSLETQLNIRKNKIINTSDFVFSANTSLNAIKLFDALTKYLDEISTLNNPSDSTLGFSLSTQIQEILSKNIIKGKNKLNNGKTNKFVGFVENIIKSPIIETFATSIPVVNSIKTVIDLVIGTATRGNDIDIKDVMAFKTDLKVYLEHYEGLAKIQDDFSKNINSIDVRKSALITLLSAYTKERISTLTPGVITKNDNSLSTTKIINKFYTSAIVKQKVNDIINIAPKDYETHLNSNTLLYPDFALNQAKFIKDEITALGIEYISAYASYQKSIEEVLNKSITIGVKSNIDTKISSLKGKLTLVEKTFEDGMNLEDLNNKFLRLSEF